MKPRTLFVDHAGVLGGAELFLLDVVCRLKSTGHVLLFEKGPFFDRLKEEIVPVSVIEAPDSVMGVDRSGGCLNDLLAIPGIVRMVYRVRRMALDFDVIYANSQKALIVCALAGKLARKPVIWNLHDIMTADHFSRSHRKIAISFANRLVDRVIVNSEATRQSFIDCGGDASKTHVVYNGIDASLFDSVDDETAENLKTELGLEDSRVVGLFSRLTPWKGQHVLIEAISRLPDVHALLVGGALFQDDATYENELHDLVRRLGVEDRVHFLGFRDDVPFLMKAMDIVVHCSTAPEPFGRVIVEAMLAKRPVIASSAGGALEIVEDGKTGLLTSPGDADALEAAIRKLLADPKSARNMARAGYSSAYGRFALESIVRELELEIRKVSCDSNVSTCPEASASAA